MPISNYPGGFPNGVNIRGLNVLNTYGGNVRWVDSGAGSDGNPGTFNRPYSTIDYAIGQMTANNGDVIMVKPGHVEDMSAASAIDFDVAGITVIGLGHGPGDMPRIDWEATAATLVVDAANTVLYNLELNFSIAAVAVGVDQGAVDGCGYYNLLVIDETAAIYGIKRFTFADGADYVNVMGNTVIGKNAANDEILDLEGSHVGCKFNGNYFSHGVAQATMAPMILSATAFTHGEISYNDFVSLETAGHWAVTLTGTGNTGSIAYNRLASLDVAGAQTAGLDITGAHAFENYVSGETGTYALVGGAAEGVYVNA